jgi:hypothetical protein
MFNDVGCLYLVVHSGQVMEATKVSKGDLILYLFPNPFTKMLHATLLAGDVNVVLVDDLLAVDRRLRVELIS